MNIISTTGRQQRRQQQGPSCVRVLQSQKAFNPESNPDMPAFDDQVRHHTNLRWATAETHGGMMDARPPAFEPVCMAPSGGKLGKLDWVRVRVNSAVVLDHVEKAALQWHGFKHGSHTVTGCPVPGYHATHIRSLFQVSGPGTSGILNDGALWTARRRSLQSRSWRRSLR